jgi:hypothetical protein
MEMSSNEEPGPPNPSDRMPIAANVANAPMATANTISRFLTVMPHPLGSPFVLRRRQREIQSGVDQLSMAPDWWFWRRSPIACQ